MDEDATGKERVAHQVRRRAPLRRENSESTSDTSRKRTSGAEGAPYAKTQGGAAAPGRPSLYPPLYQVLPMAGQAGRGTPRIEFKILLEFLPLNSE